MVTDETEVQAKVDMLGVPVWVKISLPETATPREKAAWGTFIVQIREGLGVGISFEATPYKRKD